VTWWALIFSDLGRLWACFLGSYFSLPLISLYLFFTGVSTSRTSLVGLVVTRIPFSYFLGSYFSLPLISLWTKANKSSTQRRKIVKESFLDESLFQAQCCQPLHYSRVYDNIKVQHNIIHRIHSWLNSNFCMVFVRHCQSTFQIERWRDPNLLQ
jgi:hypothetical protein